MFFGLVDRNNFPFGPDVVSRVAVETIEWNMRASDRPSTFEILNRNAVRFKVRKQIHGVGGFAWFREADDHNPIHPPRCFGRGPITETIYAGELVSLEPGRLVLECGFVELTPEREVT